MHAFDELSPVGGDPCLLVAVFMWRLALMS
jgi:hypothetical protein